MRNYYRVVLMAVVFALLTGCHTMNDPNLFRLGASDATISAKVQDALLHNDSLAKSRIHVNTTNGEVMLSGYVRTIRQSDTAEMLAKKVSGVRSVRNNIIVRR